jgi:hypothetical protein
LPVADVDLPEPVDAVCHPARFRRVLREALAIRQGRRTEYPGDAVGRARDTAELTAWAVASETS